MNSKQLAHKILRVWVGVSNERDAHPHPHLSNAASQTVTDIVTGLNFLLLPSISRSGYIVFHVLNPAGIALTAFLATTVLHPIY